MAFRSRLFAFWLVLVLAGSSSFKIQLLEEVSDPQLVNRSLSSFKVVRNLALRVTIFFFRTQMSSKDIVFLKSDRIESLRFNMERMPPTPKRWMGLFSTSPVDSQQVELLRQELGIGPGSLEDMFSKRMAVIQEGIGSIQTGLGESLRSNHVP